MNLPRLLSQWYRLIRAVLVLACILALLVILLGRLLMPQVSTLTPNLLNLLEANTDLFWEIEGLSGEWQHFKPIIRIESLTAQFSHDQPALGACPASPILRALLVRQAPLAHSPSTRCP